ncbi:MAG: hypothetical protein CME63_06810 [Halobacteriovoraceae bacterium]|nr:hypothetical protein [Halobacteriovoraceae bacterium]
MISINPKLTHIILVFFIGFVTLESNRASSFYQDYESDSRINPVVLTPEQQRKVEELLDGNLAIEEIEDERIWHFLYGGDIIGNGGGLAESYFRYAYQNLYKYINEYLITYKSQMDTNDYINLATIANIRNLAEQKDYALIFLNGDEGIFNQSDIPHRIAMTAYHPGAPILINRSQLYHSETGDPIVTQSDAVAILIHEMGHQAGIKNHAYLDKLGNLIKAFIDEQSERIIKHQNDQDIIFTIKNPIVDSILFESQFITDRDYYDVRDQIMEQIECPQGSDLDYLTLWNLHWLRSDENSLKVGLWADFYCREEVSSSLYSQTAEIVVEIHL